MTLTTGALHDLYGEPRTLERVGAVDVARFACGCEARRLPPHEVWAVLAGCDGHRDLVLAYSVM